MFIKLNKQVDCPEGDQLTSNDPKESIKRGRMIRAYYEKVDEIITKNRA